MGTFGLAMFVRGMVLGAVLCAAQGLWIPAFADGLPLTAGTKLRIGVVNWSPVESAYKKWEAVGGDFLVSEQGTFRFPLIGQVSALDSDSDRVGDEIASRLQVSTGLVLKPEVTIEVLEYAPIYVLGSVANPGEYKFRPGMTVLQAYALGGGPERNLAASGAENQMRLAADLKNTELMIALGTAKIARLEAELDGEATIDFSNEGPFRDAEFNARESVIFDARGKELTRQLASLNELRTLLDEEAKVLEQKQLASDDAIATAEKQLEAVKTLVEKGVAVASRQSDLERELSAVRSDKLDQITAAMRARQGIAEAKRNIDGLRDRQRTEVATTLQAERVSLKQAELKRELTRNLLIQIASETVVAAETDEQSPVIFTISRMQNGVMTETVAKSATRLLPGDVVTAGRAPPSTKADSASAMPPATTGGNSSVAIR